MRFPRPWGFGTVGMDEVAWPVVTERLMPDPPTLRFYNPETGKLERRHPGDLPEGTGTTRIRFSASDPVWTMMSGARWELAVAYKDADYPPEAHRPFYERGEFPEPLVVVLR